MTSQESNLEICLKLFPTLNQEEFMILISNMYSHFLQKPFHDLPISGIFNQNDIFYVPPSRPPEIHHLSDKKKYGTCSLAHHMEYDNDVVMEEVT
jgi:hypothetical protein